MSKRVTTGGLVNAMNIKNAAHSESKNSNQIYSSFDSVYRSYTIVCECQSESFVKKKKKTKIFYIFSFDKTNNFLIYIQMFNILAISIFSYVGQNEYYLIDLEKLSMIIFSLIVTLSKNILATRLHLSL